MLWGLAVQTTEATGATGVEAAGFGFVVALVALVVAAILARRR